MRVRWVLKAPRLKSSGLHFSVLQDRPDREQQILTHNMVWQPLHPHLGYLVYLYKHNFFFGGGALLYHVVCKYLLLRGIFLLDPLIPTFVLHVELQMKGICHLGKGLRPGHFNLCQETVTGTFAFYHWLVESCVYSWLCVEYATNSSI